MQKISQSSTPKPYNWLVVCHGNICRSPLAGAVLAAALGADRVRSRGVKQNTKGPASKKVREWAAARGIDLSTHRAVSVREEDLQWADVVYYMDEGNRARLPEEYRAKYRKLGVLIGKTYLSDPAFIPRGPVLDQMLQDVYDAALQAVILAQ